MGRTGPAFPEVEDDAPDGMSYDEQPAHRVTISSAFDMDTAPVTQAQWEAAGMAGLAGDASHTQALAYATAISKATGVPHRLPTEAEWEMVFVATRPVGIRAAPSREWLSDWYGEYPVGRANGERRDPGGPRHGLLRCQRDASGRATFRLALPPGATAAGHGYPNATLRLVRPAAGGGAPFLHAPPFSQSAVLSGKATPAHKHTEQRPVPPVDVALFGPDPNAPHFAVRFAMPIPPDSADADRGGGVASLAGFDPATMWHSHSPGLEAMPNGDLLAVFFSSPANSSIGNESSNMTRMVQARLRHGAVLWDPPELFYDTKGVNDQSALLWRDGRSVRFFGGGRTPNKLQVPFQLATSVDSGATWRSGTDSSGAVEGMQLPIVDATSAGAFTPQPITSAFRKAHGSGSGDVLFGMDGGGSAGSGATSGLWRSSDDGVTWRDAGGRTAGRHTTFLEQQNGTILALGGKISDIDGWMPAVRSDDCGKTYSTAYKLPFPALGGNQRPSVLRLASGRMAFVADSQVKGSGKQPESWAKEHPLGSDSGVYIALSEDEGESWTFRFLPEGLPHEDDKKNFGTLGYATVRQAPNGVLHVLSTMTHPCLHYELNEAWILAANTTTTTTAAAAPVRREFTELTAGSEPLIRAKWGALTAGATPRGYALDGAFTAFYPDGAVEYNATFLLGRREREAFYDADGAPIWRWRHDNARGNSTLEQLWADGSVRVRSRWLNRAHARDYALIPTNPEPSSFTFDGFVAHGTACVYDEKGGLLAASIFAQGELNGTAVTAADEC